MSLSKLPDLVKSQICSFLDFHEIKKVEQTNKKIQGFLKRYKLEKPKITFLRVSLERPSDTHITCCASGQGYDKIFHIEYLEARDIHTTNILTTINKFISIQMLSIDNITLNEDVGWKTVATKIQYGYFHVVRLLVSKDTLVKFLKQFKHVEFWLCDLDPSYINDEMFAVLSENGTTLDFIEPGLEVPLTDLTLDTLSIKKHFCEKIKLSGLITEFTVERIKKMVEMFLLEEFASVDWNFGTMKAEKYYEAQKFMDEELKEMIDRLSVPFYCRRSNSSNNICYSIHHPHRVPYDMTFSVKKPEDVIHLEEEQGDLAAH